jgi:hypothetical protein
MVRPGRAAPGDAKNSILREQQQLQWRETAGDWKLGLGGSEYSLDPS